MSGGAAMPASTARLRAVITDVPDRYTRGISLRDLDARRRGAVAVMERTTATAGRAPEVRQVRRPTGLNASSCERTQTSPRARGCLVLPLTRIWAIRRRKAPGRSVAVAV